MEKIKDRVKSIRFRLFLVLCISTTVVTIIIILINNVILESFYTYAKTQAAKTISTELNDYYNSNSEYDINSELRQLEIKNNIEILIESKDGDLEYCGNRELSTVVSKIKNNITAKTIYNSDNTIIKRYEDVNNRCLLLVKNLDNGYKLYIRIPITPIKESVRISNESLILIGILMILISGILSSFLSKKFTEPIIQLNGITKKMSKLDFSEKYEITGENDEIDTLGKNINIMSDKLQTTIGQLRQNNNELEKDIEKKARVDEMRKQFISDVSHELKTPISLIQGYAEGLAENVNSDEESRRFYAEVIIDESNKMDKMVKELLELMRLEYQERKFNNCEFDLTEVINEEIRRQTLKIKENNITIEFDEKKKRKVYADQEYIEQVVNNYLTNAIKHCDMIKNEKKIIVRTEKINNKLRLFVYNTGKKISQDNINKIWGRFYKVDSSRNREQGGTGIGLALVKAIMNNYNNEYGVKNFENGVEFYGDINIKKD